jgi:hypothetical protein
MFRNWMLLAVIALSVLAVPLRAEKRNLTPQELRKLATHIVTGTVTAIYTRTETKGNLKYTRFVAEVRVDTCEKGDGVEKGSLVYIRYWRSAWIGEGHRPPGTSGHRGLPSEQESMRVYLVSNGYDGFSRKTDGGFNVIGANGFEQMTPASSD